MKKSFTVFERGSKEVSCLFVVIRKNGRAVSESAALNAVLNYFPDSTKEDWAIQKDDGRHKTVCYLKRWNGYTGYVVTSHPKNGKQVYMSRNTFRHHYSSWFKFIQEMSAEEGATVIDSWLTDEMDNIVPLE